MTVILDFSASDVVPDRAAVLKQLAMPPGTTLPDHVEQLYGAAAALLDQTIAPRGVLAEISSGEFDAVYRGEGRNEPRSPVAEIFGRAEHLALFAVTLGQGVTEALARSFAADDFALAYMLDAMASVAADDTADLAERRYGEMLRAGGWATPEGAVLRYSPGYCGWDVTGQRKLFQYLRPGEIGLTLTDSCLMQPLKSVSGVMIAGPRAIHRFPPTYDFCDRCEARTCRERIRGLGGRERWER